MLATAAPHTFTGTKRFVVEREIGHGGMGVVYQALDLERNTRVALKALTQKDALNIYRLKNEFRQLADVSHPNLVTLHELCNEGNSWFFTMELVKGRSFDEYVAEERTTPPPTDRSRFDTVAGRHSREASITLSQRAIASEFPLPRITSNVKRLRDALRQLVEAVAALHEAGKLHRDLKPSNVLVTPEGRVVVLDFGLVSDGTIVDPSAQDADRTVGGCVFGTPAYMSPEQAAGEAVTTASDWYAIGTMLYEALTGQLPFDGTVLEILRQKEENEPPAPSELVRGVPDDLDQLCRDLLRRDPELRPAGDAILRYLTGHSAPRPLMDAQASAATRQHRELFVGRESHLAELRRAFEDAKNGKPVSVLVHGASGIGKSALVRCFANELIRNDEAVVLRGRCYERETVPYKAFDNIIDALSRYMMRLPAEEAAELLPRNVHSLAVLFPVLRRVKAIAHARRPKHLTSDARELRNQAFTALKDLLLRITDFHPLVLNIDDLQWADTDSARLLSFLIGPPGPPPLLLIGTYRRDEADNSPFLRQLESDRGMLETSADLRELAVDALGEKEAAQLTAALLHDLPEATALFTSAVAAEAEGVPFFITELVQHLRGRGEHDSVVARSLPLSLDQVILERVAGMPADAQTLLRVLSIAAAPLEQGVAMEAAGLPLGERSPLLALRAARLIRTRGTRQADTAETYHDRVREAVASTLNEERVREIHSQIAHAMERHDLADPERLVVHYNGAGNGVRAGETAIEAAHRAARKLAFNRAAELFKRAIDLLPDSDPGRHGLHQHLGDALANAGRGAQAAEAYLKAAEAADAAESRKLQRLAAQQYLRSGRIAAGTELAEKVLGEVGVHLPRWNAITAIQIAANRWFADKTSYDCPESEEVSLDLREKIDACGAVFRELGAAAPLSGAYLHSRYLQFALRAGDRNAILHGLAWEAIFAAGHGGANGDRRCETLLRKLDEVSTAIGSPEASAVCNMARAASWVYRGRFRDAVHPARAAERLYAEHHSAGTYWERDYLAALHYLSLQVTGELEQIIEDTPKRMREAKERDDLFASTMLLMTECICCLATDRPERALSILNEQSAALDQDRFNNMHLSVTCRMVDTLLYCGRADEALAFIERVWPRYEDSVLGMSQFTRTVANYAMARALVAAAAERRDSQLLRRARIIARELSKEFMDYARSCALLIEAAIANIEGKTPLAVKLLDRASREMGQAGLTLYEASAQIQLGRIGNSSETFERAERLMRLKRVQRPDLWAGIWCPGFARST